MQKPRRLASRDSMAKGGYGVLIWSLMLGGSRKKCRVDDRLSFVMEGTIFVRNWVVRDFDLRL